jgi:hypothetical protein
LETLPVACRLEVQGVFVVSNVVQPVVQAAALSGIRAAPAWRRRARAGYASAARAQLPGAEQAVVRAPRRASAAHGQALSCRIGFYASARAGKVLPWQAGNPTPVVRKRTEWSNGVLGMNLAMAGVEGTLVLQAVGAILTAGIGVALVCLAVFMLGDHAYGANGEKSAGQQDALAGVAEPVEQAQAVVSSYRLAGNKLGALAASAGQAYETSAFGTHGIGQVSILGLNGPSASRVGVSRE